LNSGIDSEPCWYDGLVVAHAVQGTYIMTRGDGLYTNCIYQLILYS